MRDQPVGDQASTKKRFGVRLPLSRKLSECQTYLFNANGAVFISVRHRTDSPWRTWDIAPGILVKKISSALKARFNCAPAGFSRRSVWRFVAQALREFANAVCVIETRGA